MKPNKVSNNGDYSLNNFVIEFRRKYDHLPMFWIIEQKIKNYASKKVGILKINILKKTFCVYQGQKKLSLKELAQEHGMTKERIRQIRTVFNCSYYDNDNQLKRKREVNKNNDKLNTRYIFELLKIQADDNEWSYYRSLLENHDVVWQEDNMIAKLLEHEQSTLSHKFFLQILSEVCRDTHILLGGFKMNEKHNLWKNAVLIKREFSNVFNFEKFRYDFANLLYGNEIEFLLNVDDYISNSECWIEHNTNKLKPITSIARNILLYEFNLFSGNIDGKIKIPAMKKRNLFNAVYEILEKKGEPMQINDVFDEFKKIYPKHKHTLENNPERLRPYLLRHDEITIRNRNSTYLLKKWKHVKSGTIRDAIVEFLTIKDYPQTAKDITEYVLLYFPETNIENTRASLLGDTLNRFSYFKGYLFGLVGKEYPPEYKLTEQMPGLSITFEQRLGDLEKFIVENNRFPFSSSKEKEEASLYRWWYKVVYGYNLTTKPQRTEVMRVQQKYAKYTRYKSDKKSYRNRRSNP